MTNNLKYKTKKGVKWTTISQISKQMVQFGFGVILARILSPSDFGLLSMIMIFIAFADLFVDFGLGSAIVQEKNADHCYKNTAFIFNILMGLIFIILFFFLAPYIAKFYNQPQITYLTRLASLLFLLNALNSVQIAELRKSMEFKTLFYINNFTLLISSLIAVFFALTGFGVLALIIRSLTGKSLEIILTWWIHPFKPKLYFNRQVFSKLYHYCIHLLGFNVFNYWARQADNLIIGKYLGATDLGIYNRAYQLMLLPVRQIQQVLTTVMFPALCTLQDNLVDFKRVYLTSTLYIALISFPIMIFLFFIADDFIIVIYGQKWADVIPIFKILCFVGMTQSITTTNGWIFTALGKTKMLNIWGILSGSLIILSFLVSILWGMKVLVITYATMSFILMFPIWYISFKLIDLTIKEVLLGLAPIFFISTISGYASNEISKYFIAVDWIRVIFFVLLSTSFYLLMMELTKNKTYFKLKNEIFKKKNAS